MALNILVRTAKSLEITADVLVIGVFAEGASRRAVSPALDAAHQALGAGLKTLLSKEEFTGKKDQSVTLPTLGRLPAPRLVLMGLGDRGRFTSPDVRAFAAKAARAASSEKARSLVLELPDGLEKDLRHVAEGLELGAYRFSKYFTGDRKPKAQLESATIIARGRVSPADARKRIQLGQQIAAGVNLSRDLSNEPANVLTPAALATAAQKAGKEHGFRVEVWDFKEIVRRGMRLIQAVGQGSANEPRFVHMSYVPSKKAKKKYVFVGKGVTFDSGGLSIKPAANMGEMKHDMSGAGNMVGLMAAVAALKPRVEVHAMMACAENMPDGKAYRPGDVWSSYEEKTVEIVNTDAEGRLILADALSYAHKLDPDLLVDNATLTGACVVALGTTCTGYYATNDKTASEFAAAIKESGEQMWRLPLIEELKDQLKSDVADLKHTGDRWGGSITAALFLREFIGKTKNWVHADIAGPATSDRATGWIPKGATGHAVLTFVSLIERAAR